MFLMLLFITCACVKENYTLSYYYFCCGLWRQYFTIHSNNSNDDCYIDERRRDRNWWVSFLLSTENVICSIKWLHLHYNQLLKHTAIRKIATVKRKARKTHLVITCDLFLKPYFILSPFYSHWLFWCKYLIE